MPMDLPVRWADVNGEDKDLTGICLVGTSLISTAVVNDCYYVRAVDSDVATGVCLADTAQGLLVLSA